MKSKFLTVLQTQDIDDGNFFLLSPLVYQSDYLKGCVIVPKGFTSDGSSTPRVPLIYTLYGNRSHHEGVVHDYLYRVKDHKIQVCNSDGSPKFEKTVEKSEADLIFKEAMISRGKSWYIVQGMYLGVKFGGASSWRTGNERYSIYKENTK